MCNFSENTTRTSFFYNSYSVYVNKEDYPNYPPNDGYNSHYRRNKHSSGGRNGENSSSFNDGYSESNIIPHTEKSNCTQTKNP